ncbi:extracellular solute-binding protein [Ruminococcaceae bacterium OttesenSCG-928-L11]|nr:extracellular solute-binding protein [Ruminococcaceae bacterium OttesenSCG-928-L11]
MIKRLSLLLLSVLLIAQACACSGGGTTPSSTSAPGSQSTAQAPADAASPSQEVIPLTIFRAGSRPMNDQTEMVRQFIIDTIGVDMQLEQIAENANQQLALRITSGDIPDMMMLTYDAYVEYAQDGAFYDISSEVEAHSSLMEYVGDNWDKVKVDGAIYSVPNMLSVPTSYVTAIRQDWLDKLGLSSPKTLEEYTNVLRAFTNNDPDGNGKNDTYGVCSAGLKYLSPFLGAFGATADQFYFLNDDGTITTNAISEEYRQGLAYLRDIYAEGLVDPECFTADTSQATEKWGRAQFGVWPGWWSHAGNAVLRSGFQELQPDAVVEIIFPPVGENGQQGNLYAPPFDSVVALSHTLSPEKVDAALRLLDYQTTTYGFYVVMWGLENVGFEMNANNEITWCYSMDGKDRLGNEVTDMEVYKLLYNEKLQRPVDSLGDDMASVLYGKATDIQFASTSRENIFAYTKTPEYVENNAELERYFTENAIRFIMGDRNLDTEWEQYKDGYLSMGGEIVRQSLLKAYNDKTGTSYTFKE